MTPSPDQSPNDVFSDAACGDESRQGEPLGRLRTARLRLQAAIEALDGAVSRQAERATEMADQFAEFEVMQEDRSRLAQQLDGALDRLGVLEFAHGEAARRVERASAAVRAVLASADASNDAKGEE